MKTDLELKKDVSDELQWEPGLNAAGVGVSVKNGIVTLTGDVGSYREKWDAERAAKRVLGVKGIAAEIQVKPAGSFKMSDAHIASAAVDALRWNVAVPDERIKVTVEDGRLTLEGEVEWQYQKEAAFNAVHSLAGVRWVTNEIAVKPRVSASDIKAKIEAAFKRSAQVDAQAVTVGLTGNKVTLRGKVHSWAEREEAEHAAWAAPGVASVENNLVLTTIRNT